MTLLSERSPEQGLVAARAGIELATRRRLAQIVAARTNGLSQRAIADQLQISQPAVAKLEARAGRAPQEWRRTVRQVALEYAAGELTREQMRAELVGWPWTSGHLDGPDGAAGQWAESWVAGSWDELIAAVSDGLVDETDYAHVFERTSQP